MIMICKRKRVKSRMDFTFLIFIVFILQIVNSHNQSPCPEIFFYEPKGSEEDRWYGVVSLKTDEDLTGVYVNILLDRPAQLLGNWFGDTSSTDNTEFIILNQKYKLEVGPSVSVRFFVKYDPNLTVPSVKSIRLNGRTICPAKEGSLGTTTERLHISQQKPSRRPQIPSQGNDGSGIRDPNLNGRPNPSTGNGPSIPTGTNTDSKVPQGSVHLGNNNGLFKPDDDDGDDNSFFTSPIVGILDSNQNKPGSQSPSQNSFGSSSCGIRKANAVPLISFGQDTTPGEWPWHAALYYSKGIQLVYSCGATLITTQHVITAAHCVTKPRTDKPVNERNLRVYLGKYNLIDFGNEVQERGVSDLYVHPNYNNSRYFNDIAIIKLSRPVEITEYVRTICLWDEGTSFEILNDRLGTVVGWGFDQNMQLSNKLMQAEMPVVSTISCIYSNRDFYSQFTSEYSYCAGFRNGTSVCNGDSGGGMVFPRQGTSGQNAVWQIRGIVSVGVALQGKGLCDTTQYIVFTDVAKYNHWIRQVVAL